MTEEQRQTPVWHASLNLVTRRTHPTNAWAHYPGSSRYLKRFALTHQKAPEAGSLLPKMDARVGRHAFLAVAACGGPCLRHGTDDRTAPNGEPAADDEVLVGEVPLVCWKFLALKARLGVSRRDWRVGDRRRVATRTGGSRGAYWTKQADIDNGASPGTSSAETTHRRLRLSAIAMTCPPGTVNGNNKAAFTHRRAGQSVGRWFTTWSL